MKKWLLLAVLMLAPIIGSGQAIYTDRAVGTFPGTNHATFLVPIQYGQVRVCTAAATGSPCTPLASITDPSGNPLSVLGGNFGQLTTDVVGRFSFGCSAGNYLIQVAASASNVPQLSYSVTCPILGTSFGATPFTGDITMVDTGCYKWGSVGITLPDTFLCRGGVGLVRLGTTAGAVNGALDTGTVSIRQALQSIAGSAGVPPINFGLGGGSTSGFYFALNGGPGDQVGISIDTLPTLVVKSGRTDIFGSVSTSTTPGLAFGNDGVLDSAIWRTGGKTFSVGSSTVGDASGTLVANILTSNGASNGVFIGSQVTPGILQFTNLVAGSTVLSGSAGSLFVGNALNDTSGTVSATNVSLASGGLVKFGTDTGVSRSFAGAVAIGTGAAGNASGSVIAGSMSLSTVMDTNFNRSALSLANTFPVVWSSTAASSGSPDTGLSRTAAATVAVGNGTQGDTSGNIVAATFQPSAAATTTPALGGVANTRRIIYNNANGGFEFEFLTNVNSIAGIQIAGMDVFETGGTAAAAGHASLWGDSATHRWGASNNGGGSYLIVGSNTVDTLTNKRVTPRALTSSSGAAAPITITPDTDSWDQNSYVLTGTGGTLTINAPSPSTPTDGQKHILRIKSTNAMTYSFNAIFRFSTTVVAPVTLAAGKTDYIGLMWNSTDSKWDVVAVDQGH